MKTLLTGFGPFGNVIHNPSARIVRRLAETGVPGHVLTVRILPVSFERATEAISGLLIKGSFDAAVMVGVAGKEPEIRIETCGRNWDEARIPDCDGFQPEGWITSGGADALETSIDTGRLLDELHRAGLPARLSMSAGAYVCNRVYYTALRAAIAHGLSTRCLFIHVPADPDTFGSNEVGGGMPFDDQLSAVTLVLTVLARKSSAILTEP